jgi:subtilisin family serine protease
MMHKHTFLHGPKSLAGLEPMGAIGEASIAAATIEVAELEPADAANARKNPTVAADAPAMPIRLITPFNAKSDPSVPAPAAVWGVDAVQATRSTKDGTGVVVAVLDTGIDASHPAFAGVNLVQKDFSGSGNGDANGHGTHCAGTIFGRDVNGQRIGIARGVTTVLIGKVLGNDGSGSSDAIFSALNWALESGAKIVSMSLGFDFPGMVKVLEGQGWPTELATSSALEAYRANLRMFDAIMRLAAARVPIDGGAVIVAAAGNESRRDENPDWRIPASLPAAAEGVISVGAAARSGAAYAVAPFSNTLPVVCGPGVAITSAKVGGGLRDLSGTSMATPHVAGVAALYWQASASAPQFLRAKTVSGQLVTSARAAVFGSTNPDDIGAGLVTSPP